MPELFVARAAEFMARDTNYRLPKRRVARGVWTSRSAPPNVGALLPRRMYAYPEMPGTYA
jgi:hypothetical protein